MWGGVDTSTDGVNLRIEFEWVNDLPLGVLASGGQCGATGINEHYTMDLLQ